MGRFVGQTLAPLGAVTAVALAVLFVGRPRPVVGVRIFGGPTEDCARLSLRIEAVEHGEDHEIAQAGLPIVLDVSGLGAVPIQLTSRTNTEGLAYFNAPLAGASRSGNVEVAVRTGTTVLGKGQPRITRSDWQARQRIRGGWIRQTAGPVGHAQTALRLRVAPARGQFAVPVLDQLWIAVEGPDGPVTGAEFEFDPEGLTIAVKAAPSDRRGLTRITIVPLVSGAALRITARAADGSSGQWYGTLPILQGALDASRDGGRLRITSPIVRTLAYYSLISEAGRLSGGMVELQEDGQGGAVQTLDLPPWLPGRVYAVVSSEPDLNSPGAVGWPLFAQDPDELLATAPQTLTVPEILWVDGVQGRLKAAQVQRRRLQQLAASVVAAALLVVVFSLIHQARLANRKLRNHFANLERDIARNRPGQSPVPDSDHQQPTRDWIGIAVAVSCLALGFLILAIFVLLRSE